VAKLDSIVIHSNGKMLHVDVRTSWIMPRIARYRNLGLLDVHRFGHEAAFGILHNRSLFRTRKVSYSSADGDNRAGRLDMSLNPAKALLRLILVTLAGMVCLSGSARADTCDTLSRVDPDRRIAVCTFEIASEIASPSSPINREPWLVYERRALGYLQKNEFSLAIADYSQAVAMNPNILRTYLGLGVASAFLRDFDGARANFDQAERLQPNDCKTRMLSALLAGVFAGSQKVEVLRDILEVDVGAR
jgi:tetratricopeptide (TPR) repeat protein